MKKWICLKLAMACAVISGNAQGPSELVSPSGVRLKLVAPGGFLMGNAGGEVDYPSLSRPSGPGTEADYRAKGEGTPSLRDNPLEWDEHPVHPVKITRPFYMGVTAVTNAQYEKFRPEHKALRGKQGFSVGDDDAVVNVSWQDAMDFCEWLGKKDGRTYRLPTEAEWEFACRAGTTTAFSTGKTLPEEFLHHQVMDRKHTVKPERVKLTVGATLANPWGLQDMHGLVEEWCLDWYGPYRAGEATDPSGPQTGLTRVTRGGSHTTGLPFLRSANRSAALPETRSFLIGFRVVAAEEPAAPQSTAGKPPLWSRDVNQERWSPSPVDSAKPVFLEPRTYTRVPDDANGPLFITHNHCPTVTACPNGDLLAVWFTTSVERGREMVLAASRLRRGNADWDEASLFFQVADRNVTGSALWWDGKDTLHHFNGLSQGDNYRDLAMIMRSSTDNGASWSTPRFIADEFQPRHQVIDTVVATKDGSWVLLSDATSENDGGTAVHISKDEGKTWDDPGTGKPEPDFAENASGAWIAGIHAGAVELKDGSLFALGRGDNINKRMPASLSKDGGRTWTYSASDFEPIRSAQRLELMRLKEGPLLLVSFSRELPQTDAAGKSYIGSGMFAALSFDEGRTWPVRKLITPGGPRRILHAPCNRRWGEEFSILDWDHAEGRGYLTGVQTEDGMIHILSSGTHYAFNLAWLKAPPAVKP